MIHKESYWSDRYERQETQWDAGDITTPLKMYFDQLTDRALKILIPGAGNAHEAEYLWKNGFANVFVLDISARPLQHFKNRVPDFPDKQLLHANYFELTGHYDLIIEQTFFCALHPSERDAYAKKTRQLLRHSGKLVGVLFDDALFDDHPPYGGHKQDYMPIFKKYFDIHTFERCYNSIKPREGRELFVNIRPEEINV